ncbi:3-hydroxyacyl-CoA dehydrogenase/enoyl-CoA hydratase family protein [Sphingomonas sanguinis]|uniref:3-hydroxyacyl-CoA dehydrogenase/enoyl-CoA hydratase family protein n=1 Tax=Sphingomonas sanguinis TaxID=33051 RepID=A0A7Y7QRT4_9SPHN|nr:3-hydroxyacyl-CoA dehydrogenase/enoyl-CoA hydratase family protein [Sphingomonas sanguinis]MBZ6380199.1 enoyl-CoA hydratase/isomerase family protein [Sphingomonas sanguinis]NNG48830.1 3-hydroxyacyl-CoA dehydrogenase/enoyl-CoA hydratase family protein [Sphingomonas sanguinis]NNG52077.1 3-hydroxyacyl-CoA dehydrogenase/enoyl-CoA hydratase family protein [Sphingomonas sanguinis]NVP29502.1 enoyl-CoA hydratase/isomerase family protein [Sphingomonas sanguinis]
MADTINKVCVIGAGVMGAGIAAQVANAGVPVLLLDIVPKDGGDRDAVAKGAVAKMLKTEPAPFMSPAAAKLVETGNIEDHLDKVAECDWIVEAVVERLDIKQALYAKLETLKRPGTAVSSNTSTIPLGHLVEGRSEQFKNDFLITHFFNPPRYMRLIEIVTSEHTDAGVAAKVEQFIDHRMGKRIVRAKDTPGFIANRIGTYWLAVAINAAMDQGLTVEEADQIGGRPMGVPKTGIFGLIDLVGIDLMPLLAKSLSSTLPEGDAYFDTIRPLPLVDKMIADGFTGRKGKGGFYRLDRKPDGTKAKQAIDLKTGEYRAEKKPERLPGRAEKDLAALVATPGKVGDYAWAILGPVLSYAAGLVGEAADDIVAIDDAMKLGYNWKFGPFELIDRMGPGKLAERLRAEGKPVPALLETAGDRPFYRVVDGKRQYLTLGGDYADVVRAEGVLLLEDIKLRSEPLLKNGSASAWDVGDGVVAFEFTGKMNALDEQVLSLLQKTIALVKSQYKALVIYNEGSNFSAGANLGLAMFAVNIAAWGEVDKLVVAGQQAYKALKYAPFPVVAAPAGMALGGGCEILLHADAIQAHAESYIGLVETGVGLVPGWGGNGELIDRLAKSPKMPKGPMPAAMKAFETISTAQVSRSAALAKDLGYLRKDDGITMNRDRLLADAKQKALSLVEGYQPPEKPVFRLPGAAGRVAFNGAVADFAKKGVATPYDVVVAGRLANIVTGGEADIIDEVSEDQLLKLERAAFMESVKDARTQARVEHMLETGKPLRN